MPRDKLATAVELLSAFVVNNSVTTGDLPALLETIHAALSRLDASTTGAAEPKRPAVPISSSITPDFLVCLEDGKRFRSMKRHLGKLGLTPQQYRQKWKLPRDYPMVAPSYSVARAKIAKDSGFGKKAQWSRKRKSKQ